MSFSQLYANTPISLAPMAGVTDRPFRQLCREWGASHAVAEMLTSDTRLWNSKKSRLRMDHSGETGIRIVQIAGAEPEMLAHAAQENVRRGAQVIDINMGCPAKKVCKKAAGSALLADEKLVEQILKTVVQAVDVPVTLKFRTGPCRETKNALRIARIAEDAGIRALALHGRSRADAYKGEAEHDSVAQVKQAVSIPVLANGDITNPQDAERILQETGVDGLLIGRGAQGRPWLFQQIHHYLKEGSLLPDPDWPVQAEVAVSHVRALHAFYGDEGGLRVARKHIGWYLENWPGGEEIRRQLVRIKEAEAQWQTLAESLHQAQQRIAA